MMIKTNSRKSSSHPRKKRRFYTRECYFTSRQISYIDYKNVVLLRRFISRSGIILPKKVTGTKTRYQKHLATAIKRARFMGLLSYTSNND